MIQELNAHEVQTHLDAFKVLLRDAVEGGASIGFVLPLSEDEVNRYWQEVVEAVQGGNKRLFGAFSEGQLVGTVQLNLETRSNGLHRAEIAKLIVLGSHRKRGIGKALLDAAEGLARKLDRRTLYLDTVLGCPAERLYRFAGYTFAGSIANYATDVHGTPEPNAIFYKLL